MSLGLVDEIESGPHDGDAFNAAGECAALLNGCEGLLEDEVDAE